MFAKSMRVAVTGMTLFMLAGCSVGLPVEEATARAATDAEVRGMAADGYSANGIGRWTKVTAVLSRSTVKRIIRWELYAGIHVTNCDTNRIIGVVAGPDVDGTYGDEFDALERLLETQPLRRFFSLSGFIIERPRDAGLRQCLSLVGGNYLFQRVSTDPVAIRFVGPAGSFSEGGMGE